MGPVKDTTGNGKPEPTKGNSADALASNVLIAIMGPTGTGKSSFIARLTGNTSIEIGHGVESATSEIGLYNHFWGGDQSVTFIDTPGFDDSREGMSDTKVLGEIATTLAEQFSKDRRLHGIIYLHRITDTRLGGVSARNLRMFRKLCGEDALKNVVVVTTRWDDIQEKDRAAMEKREKELMETPGRFFEPLISLGGHFLRHDNTADSAAKVMKALLKNVPIPLQIQLELVDGKKLEDTAAGAELAAEMKELMDKHRIEMKNLKEEMAEAIAAKDKALKEELEADRARMEEEMKKWEGQRKALAEDLAKEKKEATKRQQEADRKFLEQKNEFDRRVKEAAAKAEEKHRQLKEQLDAASMDRKAADHKIENLERAKADAAHKNESQQARIQSALDAARREKEGTDRNYRTLLRNLRAQVCHWESVDVSYGTASPFSHMRMNPPPITFTSSSEIKTSHNLFRFRVSINNGPVFNCMNSLPAWGGLKVSAKKGEVVWKVQILVGVPSRVQWDKCQGRFSPSSLSHQPIACWDQEADHAPVSLFVARFVHLRVTYYFTVESGANGVTGFIDGASVNAQNYEILCYKDL